MPIEHVKNSPTFVLKELAELVRISSGLRNEPEAAGDPFHNDVPPAGHQA